MTSPLLSLSDDVILAICLLMFVDNTSRIHSNNKGGEKNIIIFFVVGVLI